MIGRRVVGGVETLVRRRADLRPLARALWLLPLTTLRLRRTPHRARLTRDDLDEVAPPLPANGLDRARRLQRVVAIAAAHGATSGTCLSRSLTLLDLLDRERLPAVLRIGVRLPGATALEAHAWVECGGAVLNDLDDVGGRYAAFSPGERRA